MKHNPGLVPEPETTATFVVYNSADGTILHRHKVVTLSGALETTGSDAQAAALDYATRVAGFPPNRMAVLRIAEDELRPGVEYRVDVEAGRVVASDDPDTDSP